MRRIVHSIAMLAAAAAALISCNKEVNPVEPAEKEFTYTFALSNTDTRAFLDLDESITKWETGDQLGVYTVGTPGTSYNRYGNINSSELPVKFQISSYYALSAGDKVYCYFPYNAANSDEGDTRNPASVNLSIPTTQNGKMNAMPMVSVPYTMTKDVEQKTNEPIADINMRNLGGVFQFNIFSTNSEYLTETIEKVELNANAALAGSFVYDITTEELAELSGLSETSISVEDLSLDVAASKEASSKVLMVVAPGSHSGSLVVTTNAATYTLDFSSAKNVERSHIKPLNVDLAKAVRKSTDGTAFVKVTSAQTDWSGHYLIIYEGGDSYFAFNSSLDKLDAVNNGDQVTLNSDNAIDLDENSAAYVFTVAPMDGGYSVKASNGKYISGTKDSNTLNEGVKPVANTFTWKSNRIEIKSNTYLTYNNASGQDRFRYMKTDNGNIFLYKLNGKFNPDFPTLAVSDREVASNALNVSIPVTSNRDWTAEITEGAELIENGSLTAASGRGDGSIEFKFAAVNKSVSEVQVVKIHIVADTKEADITVTHNTLGAQLYLEKLEDSVEADATEYTVNVTSANFAWNVLSYTIGNEEQTITEENCTKSINSDFSGSVTVKFPSNAANPSATSAREIKVTIGYADVISRTITITQDGDAPLQTDGWIETSFVDIKSDDVFVITSNGYALSSANGTAGSPAAVQVTVLGNAITSEVTDALKWTVTGNATDGYTFYAAGTTNALYSNTTAASSANTNLRVGAPTSGTFRNVFEFATASDNTTLKTKDSYTARYINLYNNADWRGYTSNSTSTNLVFFVLKDSRTPQPDFGFSSNVASYDLYTKVGSYPSLSGALTAVTYKSSDESVATVDADGTVHPKKVGTTIITASTADDDSVYKPVSDQYTLTITDSNPGTGGDVVVLNEEFDNGSSSDSSSAIESKTFSNFSGATSKAYKSQYGGIKFGTGSAVGYITSKPLDLSNSFSVTLNVLKYGSDSGKIQVTVGSVTKEITPTDIDTEYTLDFDAATATSTVKIGTSAKRAYIDNVIITRHD